ncbi:MAG: RNase adaptor protein RapZ, partial [Gammaproteobacteria bacterium]|nr:RNase adaptor protein RapZ [Gammaproteobacteria bacterium]
ALSIQLISFGFKHGTPHDADFIFDVRCLPNPYWEQSLRGLTGKDKEIIDFLDKQPAAHKMSEQLAAFLSDWLVLFDAENRSYLTIGIGCTGGRHRSVYIIEKLAQALSAAREQLIIKHRDL